MKEASEAEVLETFSHQNRSLFVLFRNIAILAGNSSQDASYPKITIDIPGGNASLETALENTISYSDPTWLPLYYDADVFPVEGMYNIGFVVQYEDGVISRGELRIMLSTDSVRAMVNTGDFPRGNEAWRLLLEGTDMFPCTIFERDRDREFSNVTMSYQ